MTAIASEQTRPQDRGETPDSAGKKPRSLPLDVLRCIAILLVLGRHAAVAPATAGRLHSIANAWYLIGWTGVDLFFVLSGFLIGGLLFKELNATGKLNVRRFLVRRCFKIWPGYYALILYAAMLAGGIQLFIHSRPGLLDRSPAIRELLIQHPEYINIRAAIPNLFHLQNYLGLIRLHTWSLAVEEHFYIGLPLLLCVLIRYKKDRLNPIPALPWIAAGLILLCTTLRFMPWAQIDSGPDPLFYETHLRLDSLFFGVFLAYLFSYRPLLLEKIGRRTNLMLALGVMLISPMEVLPSHGRFVQTIGFTMLYVGYGCILLAFFYAREPDRPLGRLLGSRFSHLLGLLGRYSYSIYLWHIDFGRLPAILASRLFKGLPPELGWLLSMGTYVFLAFTAGILMGKWIEMPALKLRDRLFPDDLPATRAAVQA